MRGHHGSRRGRKSGGLAASRRRRLGRSLHSVREFGVRARPRRHQNQWVSAAISGAAASHRRRLQSSLAALVQRVQYQRSMVGVAIEEQRRARGAPRAVSVLCRPVERRHDQFEGTRRHVLPSSLSQHRPSAARIPRRRRRPAGGLDRLGGRLCGRAAFYGTEGHRFESCRARYLARKIVRICRKLLSGPRGQEFAARKLVSDSGRFSGDVFGDLQIACPGMPRVSIVGAGSAARLATACDRLECLTGQPKARRNPLEASLGSDCAPEASAYPTPPPGSERFCSSPSSGEPTYESRDRPTVHRRRGRNLRRCDAGPLADHPQHGRSVRPRGARLRSELPGAPPARLRADGDPIDLAPTRAPARVRVAVREERAGLLRARWRALAGRRRVARAQASPRG